MPKVAKILIGIAVVAIIVIILVMTYINTAFISKAEAKNYLAKKINVEEQDIHFETIELEMDKNQYEVEFYYNNHEYEAKIDAKNGNVIYTDFIRTTNNTTSNATTNNNDNNSSSNETTTQQEISIEEAKKIALDYAKLNESDLTLIKAREEHEDGTLIYEIEWHDNTYEYDFEVSKTGTVLHFDKDLLHD